MATFSGAGVIWALKAGAFEPLPFAGTQAGIQAAITFCVGGGTVYIGEGTYAIASTVSLTSNIRLMGAGRKSVLQDVTGNIIIINIADCEGFSIENLAFIGTGTIGVAGRGAIWGDLGTFGPRRGRIAGCFFDGVGTCGISLAHASQMIVEGNDIRNTKEHGIYLSYADDCTVVGNTLMNTGSMGSGGQVGIKLANASRDTLSANTIIAPEHEGILIESGTSDCVVIGNIIRDAPQRGIRFIDGSSKCSAIGNVITGAGMAGIRVHGGAGHKVSDNYFDSCADPTYTDSTATECLISDNYIATTPSGGGAIRVAGNNTLVDGNYIKGTSDVGITVATSTTGVCVINNYVRSAVKYVDDGTGTVIVDPIAPITEQLLADSATPSVLPGTVGNQYICSPAGATTITNFTDGRAGQEISIRFTNANATINASGNFHINGAFVSANESILKLQRRNSLWYEVSRSANV